MSSRQAPKPVISLRADLQTAAKNFRLIGDFPSCTMCVRPPEMPAADIIVNACGRLQESIIFAPPLEEDLPDLESTLTTILENLFKESLEKAHSVMVYTVSLASREPSDRYRPYFSRSTNFCN